MQFANQGRTNWKIFLITVFLFAIFGAGIFWLQFKEIKEETQRLKQAEENSYKTPLDIERAKRIITSFINNYNNYFNLSHKIERISFEQTFGFLIDDSVNGPVGLPMYYAYVGFTDGIGTTISFTANVLNEWPEDKIIPLEGIKTDIGAEKWPTGGNFGIVNYCISSAEKECSVASWKSLIFCKDTLNLREEEKNDDITNYFSCVLIEDKELLISDPSIEFSIDDCKECFDKQVDWPSVERVRAICDTNKSPYLCSTTKYRLYKSYNCQLDFSMEFSKSDNGKLIIKINTPKSIPEVKFKRLQGQPCEIKKPLNKGENVITTNCEYIDYLRNCIGVYYKDFEILKKECIYRR